MKPKHERLPGLSEAFRVKDEERYKLKLWSQERAVRERLDMFDIDSVMTKHRGKDTLAQALNDFLINEARFTGNPDPESNVGFRVEVSPGNSQARIKFRTNAGEFVVDPDNF